MYISVPYNRQAAVSYAQKWALSRNPAYYDFEQIGGDCTNFASQCLYAGCLVMNFRPTYGWYYLGVNNRSPSWTGVKYFYNFLTENTGAGPYAAVTDIDKVELGDFVQLYRNNTYTHTLIITGKALDGGWTVSTHTANSLNRPLQSYEAQSMRFIHILGARRLTQV